MSEFTYIRDGWSASAAFDANTVCIIGHGGGGGAFSRSHPLTNWALQRTPVVHSILLPLHGKLAQKDVILDGIDDKRSAVCDAIAQLRTVITSLVQKKYVIFIGYSTSGMMFYKLFRALRTTTTMHPASMLICVGSACQIQATAPFIRKFWLESSYTVDPKRHATMRALHTASGKRNQKTTTESASVPAETPAVDDDVSWRNCVRFVGYASGTPDSGLFSTVDERKLLFLAPVTPYEKRNNSTASATPTSSSSSRPCSAFESNYVFFVSGDQDEPFPPEETVITPLKELGRLLQTHPTLSRDLAAERVRVIPSNHFSYFIPQKKGGALELMLAQLQQLVDTYGERDLLAKYTIGAAIPRAPSTTASNAKNFAPRRIVIIGSGVFGVSAAESFTRRYPQSQIIMLEQSAVFPNPAGSSIDLNRIVRPDYGDDQLYTRWALESRQKWLEFNRKHRQDVYKETGVLFLAAEKSMYPPKQGENASYEYASYTTLQSPEFSVPLMPLKPISNYNSKATASSKNLLREHFPYWANSQLHLTQGYFNPYGGYVNAARAIALTVEELQKTNPLFRLRTGVTVKSIDSHTSAGADSGSRIRGVTLTSGESIDADLVIAACGSWTGKLIPELSDAIIVSPQPVFFVRPNQCQNADNPSLTPVPSNSTYITRNVYEDAPFQPIAKADLSIPAGATRNDPCNLLGPLPSTLYSTPFPVFSFDLSQRGWYGFPQDESGLVKIGNHGPPLLTHCSSGADGSRVLLAQQLHAFEQFAKECMPQLYKHGQLVEAKTCLYADSYDGHWLIDQHPRVNGLFVATGGSGHAFKFMPLLGELLVDIIESRVGIEDESCGLPAWATRFRWRIPSADTLRQLDVCRSKGFEAAIKQQSSDEAITPASDSRLEHSIHHFLLATGQLTAKL